MSSITDKVEYLKETKSEIKSALESKGVTVSDSDTFRSYAAKIAEIDGSGSGGSDIVIEYLDETIGASNNPFVVTEHKPGIYNFRCYNTVTSGVNIRWTSTSGVTYFTYSGLYVFTDVVEDGTVKPIGYIIDFTNGAIRKMTRDSDNAVRASSGYEALINKNGAQSIGGVKTFSVLPKSTIVPTDDAHLVNKKYVDSVVSSSGGGLPDHIFFWDGKDVTEGNNLALWKDILAKAKTESVIVVAEMVDTTYQMSSFYIFQIHPYSIKTNDTFVEITSSYANAKLSAEDNSGLEMIEVTNPSIMISLENGEPTYVQLSGATTNVRFLKKNDGNVSKVFTPTTNNDPVPKWYVDSKVSKEPMGGEGYFGWYNQAADGTDLASEYGASVDGMFSMSYGDIYEWRSTLTNGTMGGVVTYIHQYTGRDMDWNQYYIKVVLMSNSWYEYAYNPDHLYKGSAWPEESGGLACFTGDTKVLTPSGLVDIKDIKEGDIVVSVNMRNEAIENKSVSRLISHEETEIYTITTDNDTIKVTGDHPFMTKEYGRVIAKTLKKDFTLLDKDKKEHKIKKIKKEKINDTVYEIAVADNHTYFVGESNIQVFNEASVTLGKI